MEVSRLGVQGFFQYLGGGGKNTFYFRQSLFIFLCIMNCVVPIGAGSNR